MKVKKCRPEGLKELCNLSNRFDWAWYQPNQERNTVWYVDTWDSEDCLDNWIFLTISRQIGLKYRTFWLFQFSHSVMSNSLRPHELQYTRPPYPSPTVSLFKLMSIESVMPSSHLILCRTLLLLPPVPPSIRVFSNKSALRIRWPKYWSFSFNLSPSNEHPGLMSFRVDWLDLLADPKCPVLTFVHPLCKSAMM